MNDQSESEGTPDDQREREFRHEYGRELDKILMTNEGSRERLRELWVQLQGWDREFDPDEEAPPLTHEIADRIRELAEQVLTSGTLTSGATFDRELWDLICRFRSYRESYTASRREVAQLRHSRRIEQN